MKISIIGAGRTRNGIGEYIGKYFHQLGGKVTSVLGTAEKTSRQASLSLRKYGIEARPYTDFGEMVRMEGPDAVVIASPSSTHYEYLLKSLDSGFHIFCEKPFIWDDHTDLLERVDGILEKASRRKLTIAMNSQWPFSIEAYEELCGKLRIRRSNAFFIRMSPFSPGKAMIPECLPHPLSLLYCLLGPGKIEDVSFESRGEGEIDIRFTYLFETKACDVAVRLVHQRTPPREFSFGFNDKIVVRSLDLLNYEIYFSYKDKKLMIRDPLELSVKNFMEAVEKKIEPLVGTRHIIHNMSLLKEIDDSFRDFGKRNLWKS